MSAEIAGGDGDDLSAADWTGAQAEEAVFQGCTFEDVQFSESNLRGARFVKCVFVRCRFAHADVREAVFEGCSFADRDGGHQGAAFAFCEMDGAVFRGCDLSFAALERSSAYGLEMHGCNLRGARFTRVDFAKAFGRKVIRTHAKLTECNFELADLSEIALPGCDLSRCNFREADLTKADLTEAVLAGGDLFQAVLAGAKLEGADLRGAEVSGLDLLVLGSFAGLKITGAQQYRLLEAMGVDVRPED